MSSLTLCPSKMSALNSDPHMLLVGGWGLGRWLGGVRRSPCALLSFHHVKMLQECTIWGRKQLSPPNLLVPRTVSAELLLFVTRPRALLQLPEQTKTDFSINS